MISEDGQLRIAKASKIFMDNHPQRGKMGTNELVDEVVKAGVQADLEIDELVSFAIFTVTFLMKGRFSED